jgi:endoglucanase
MGKEATQSPKPRRSLWKVVVLILLVCAVTVFALRSEPGGAYIRVAGLGYRADAPMRGYFMSTENEAGAKFTVQDANGMSWYSGLVGSAAGKWGRFFVFPLDFNISPHGRYTIVVSGQKTVSSPAVTVDRDEQLYSAALANSLSFYQTQRDGSDYVSSALRTAASHLNDRSATVYLPPEFEENGHVKGDLKPAGGSAIDVSGGWWDAGDYLKFVHTTSYVEALMLMGIRDFPKQMGADANTNFTAEAKFGIEWLLRMWDDDRKILYYQVGVGSGISGAEDDHSIWRLPQADDTFGGTDPRFRYIRNRPVFVAGAAGSQVTPNLAGRLAAAFALCATVFRAQDASLADRCLQSAEHIYDLANTSPTGDLLTAAPHDFYPESEWRDDMEFGATELYLAVRGDGPGTKARKSTSAAEGLPHPDPAFYLQEAGKWAGEYLKNRKEIADTFDVADLSGLAHFELIRAIDSGPRVAIQVTRDDLLKDLQERLDRAVKNSASDSFGFGYRWDQEDTATHGLALAILASEHDYLARDRKYDAYGRRWAGSILGANSWGTSLIVGDGIDFPRCIHHQVANLAGSHDGKPPVLAGAVVEGPNGEAGSVLWSRITDWLVVKVPKINSVDRMSPCPADASDRLAAFNGNGIRFKDSYIAYNNSEPAIDLTAPSFLLFSWRMAGGPVALPPAPANAAPAHR